MAFPAVVAAALKKKTVRLAQLVELNFADGAGRYWVNGSGRLRTSDGNEWRGFGDAVAMTEIESPLGDIAPSVTLTLSGVDPALMPRFANARSLVKGRAATIYLQFYDEDWAPLDAPYPIFPGLMDVMPSKSTHDSATVSLVINSILARRSVPLFGYLSHRSQQRMFEGDRGLEEIVYMRNRQRTWPS